MIGVDVAAALTADERADVSLVQTAVSSVIAGTPAKYQLRNGWIATAGEALTEGDSVVALRVGKTAVILFEPL